MMDFKFCFTRKLLPEEKNLLVKIIKFCIENGTNMIAINEELVMQMAGSIGVEFENIPTNKFKILGQKKISGQFFLDVFTSDNLKYFLIVNPAIWELLKVLPTDEIFSKIFLPQKSYAQTFLSQILRQPETDQKWEISADSLKECFNFSNASWKSFLHRLPASEKALKNCGCLANCQIEVTYKKKPGVPVDTLLIRYTQKQNESDYTMEKFVPVIGYSPSCNAYIIDRFCSCGGLQILKKDLYNNLFYCCTNSHFWKLGNQQCDFRQYLN